MRIYHYWFASYVMIAIVVKGRMFANSLADKYLLKWQVPTTLSVWPETPGMLHQETEMKYKHITPSYVREMQMIIY